jgi:glycosyltransferase involved in cell wall biosynthesis
MSSLSVGMIVQNAEKTLAIALESLGSVYDELIIVDGGSTDSTREIGASYGAKIVESKWSGNYSKQRNIYLRKIKTDWVFVIDSDEFCDRKTLELLKYIKESGNEIEADNFQLLRRWISPFSNRHFISSYPYSVDWQIRLFRYHEELYYEGQVHEMLIGHASPSIAATVPHIYHLDLFLTERVKRSEKVHRYRQASPEREVANRLYLPELKNLTLEEWYINDVSDSVQELLGITEANLLPIRIREINLIVFPDWSIVEESLCVALTNVIRAVVTHPNKSCMTLLIDASKISEEEANLVLSSVTMNLLWEEDLDVSEGPEISLVGNLSKSQWDALLRHIHAILDLEKKNQQDFPAALQEQLRRFTLDCFAELRAVQIETGIWVLQ